MPVFEYTALNDKGKKISGIVDCESAMAARQKLRSTQVYPVSIRELSGGQGKKGRGYLASFRPLSRVKKNDVAMMTRQLSTLLGAGFTLVKALDTLIVQIESPTFKKYLSGIKDSIEEGKSFAASLGAYPGVFSPVYVNMVRAGETSGTLEIVLDRLADIAENQAALNTKIRAALAYPAFMVVIGTLVLVLLVAVVVPNMTSIFTDMGEALPLPTRILIGASDFLSGFWWVLLILIALSSAGFSAFKKTEKGAELIDRVLLKMPVGGGLVLKLSVARFSRTLATLLANGVSMMAALAVVKNIVGNRIIAETVDAATHEVEQGHELGVALGALKVFPYLSVQMIKIGEQSGELETMLDKVADVYEKEVENTLIGLTALLEPTIVLAMGLIVGGIVFSICLPIFEMNQLIK